MQFFCLRREHKVKKLIADDDGLYNCWHDYLVFNEEGLFAFLHYEDTDQNGKTVDFYYDVGLMGPDTPNVGGTAKHICFIPGNTDVQMWIDENMPAIVAANELHVKPWVEIRGQYLEAEKFFAVQQET